MHKKKTEFNWNWNNEMPRLVDYRTGLALLICMQSVAMPKRCGIGLPQSFIKWWLLIFFTGPKFFGDKVPVKMLNPVHQSTQKKIVMYHNFFRSRVHPPAADMLAMVSKNGAFSFCYSFILCAITPSRRAQKTWRSCELSASSVFHTSMTCHFCANLRLVFFFLPLSFLILLFKRVLPATRRGRSSEFV